MENNELFDYYNNSFSYVKLIMKNLNNNLETLVVREIFNEMIGKMDSDRIYEMLIVSSLFEKKLNSLNKIEKAKIINDLYSCYIKPMILNYVNNEMDLVKYFFENLNSKVFLLSGFYGIFGDDLNMFHENIKKAR